MTDKPAPPAPLPPAPVPRMPLAVPADVQALATHDWPADAVAVGRIVGAYGLKGMVRAAPESADAAALLHAADWWLLLGVQRPQRYKLATRARRLHGGAVVAAVAGVSERNGAEALKGAQVFVRRADFPPAPEDSFYWVDLIGLAVINRQGVLLGTVSGLLDNGAQAVLRVASPAGATPAERLIPFVAPVVGEVSLAERRIEVDWGEDY